MKQNSPIESSFFRARLVCPSDKNFFKPNFLAHNKARHKMEKCLFKNERQPIKSTKRFFVKLNDESEKLYWIPDLSQARKELNPCFLRLICDLRDKKQHIDEEPVKNWLWLQHWNIRIAYEVKWMHIKEYLGQLRNTKVYEELSRCMETYSGKWMCMKEYEYLWRCKREICR